jgi:hypothetical protein
MKRPACLALSLLLCACGATKIRPDDQLAGPAANHAAGDWSQLRVMVRAPAGEDSASLQSELKRTHLFKDFVQPGADESPADLVISAVDEQVVGPVGGTFCFQYALDYLTLGVLPEVCDQRYRVTISATAPATGHAAQFSVELTQRRFIGLFGLISSAFGDWNFFGPQPGDPVLARGALLQEKAQIDGLMKSQ